MSKFDVLVIGAGIQGLATAYHLSSFKNLKVGIVEQFTIGNHFGSSHGASRIIRSTYANPRYIQLMQRAYQEWPLLEKAMGRSLIHRNAGCFFGQGKFFENYAQAVLNCGLPIQELTISAARHLFPQFRFSNAKSVLCDRTGGVIAAKDTMDGLAKIAIQNGVVVREGTQVLHIKPTQDSIEVITNKEVLLTERLVVTAGPWLTELMPDLKRLLRPVRQTVGYFQLQGPQKSYQVGHFPNWAFIGEGENPVFYGLPEFGCEGIKISHHLTTGDIGNPNLYAAQGDPVQMRTLEEFVKEQFVAPIQAIVRSETCFYTNTPTEDFILDFLPNDKRIVIGSVCSGHGFKFAPLMGRILSEFVLYQTTTVPEFEEMRSLFAIRLLA